MFDPIPKAENNWEDREAQKLVELTQAKCDLAQELWEAIHSGDEEATVFQKKQSGLNQVKATDAFLDFLHEDGEVRELLDLLSAAMKGESVQFRANAMLCRFVGGRSEFHAEDYLG